MSVGGCQGPATAGVRGVGRHASGISVVSCPHRRRGTAGGCGMRRSPACLCSSVSYGRRVCRMPCAMGGRSTVSPAWSVAGVAWCGGPGASVVSWPGLVAGLWASPDVSRCGALRRPTHRPGGGVCCRPQGLAQCGRRSRAGGRWRRAGAGGALLVSLARPQTGPGPASRCGCLPRAPGARARCRLSHACVSVSPTGVGGGVARVPWGVP